MRYMWIVNPTVEPSNVISWLKEEGCSYVSRVIHIKHRCAWVFITNWTDYVRAGIKGFIDEEYLWGITSCNKQYVNDESTGKFIGCLAQCTRQEGIANVELHDSFYVVDMETDRMWTPVKRNPNRFISQELAPTSRFTEVHRPWPLPAATYEGWKDDLVKKISGVIKEHL